jgi:hypothetical protein
MYRVPYCGVLTLLEVYGGSDFRESVIHVQISTISQVR